MLSSILGAIFPRHDHLFRQSAAKGDIARVIALASNHASIIDSADDDGWTALHYATLKGHTAVVKELLKLGANANVTTNEGTTALHVACLRGHTPILLALVQHPGVLIDATDKPHAGGMTPLHKAAVSGSDACCRALLDHGASVNATSATALCNTAAHLAAARGHMPALEVLLSHGAHVDARDNDRKTPLHEAAAGGHLQCVLLLMAHGADSRAADKDGNTPGALAWHAGHSEIVRLIEPTLTATTPRAQPSAPPPSSAPPIQPSAPPPPSAPYTPSAPPPPPSAAYQPMSSSNMTYPTVLDDHQHVLYQAPAPPASVPSPPSAAPVAPSAQQEQQEQQHQHAPVGVADGDWADVGDADVDNEGGWGVGPREAAAMMRDELERQARKKTMGQHVSAAGGFVWHLLSGAVASAQHQLDTHTTKGNDEKQQYYDDDDYEQEEEEGGVGVGGNMTHDAQTRARDAAVQEPAAFAAQRMATLEAEIDKLNNWVRGDTKGHSTIQQQQVQQQQHVSQDTHYVAASTPTQHAAASTPAAAVSFPAGTKEADTEKERYQLHLEVAYLQQQLEALQRQAAVAAAAQQQAASTPSYTYAELHAATRGFDPSMSIPVYSNNEGGGGGWYKGMIHHTPIAVHVLGSNDSVDTRQLQAHVDILARIRHPHVVMLLGACVSHKCLVYEYLPGGNLYTLLHDDEKRAQVSFSQRVKICFDVASGLLALHTQRPAPLLHHNLTPSSVFLDALHTTAKVGNILPTPRHGSVHGGGATITHSQPPHSASVGVHDTYYTTASDVALLGVMIMQVLTGVVEVQDIVARVQRAVEQRRVAAVLDKHMVVQPGAQATDATALLQLALHCTHPTLAQRPLLERDVLPVLTRIYHTATVLTAQHQRREEPPSMFLCPITQEVMHDPVVCADGFTYEREAIAAWLKRKDTSPMTNAVLPHKNMTPNYVLRSAIQEWT